MPKSKRAIRACCSGASATSGIFVPPGGESYREVAKRVAAWYATVTRDTVIAAHGGVARALMANFHILPEEEATHADILHGVVYVFDGGTLARYS